jgi:ribonuclease-3
LKSSHVSLCRRLGYVFSQPSLLETALTHRSHGSANNERLEFLGDAVLSVVISEALYRMFPGCDEGSMSRLRASLVNGDALAVIARRLRLGDELLLGPGELKSGGFRRDSILAGALEAIIGAVYLEGGFDAASRMVSDIFRPELEQISADSLSKDPKTQLQEYLQARRLPLPEYRVTAVEGRDHDQRFRVECQVAGLDEPLSGEGSSRRKAEQDAASRALDLLKQGGKA